MKNIESFMLQIFFYLTIRFSAPDFGELINWVLNSFQRDI